MHYTVTVSFARDREYEIRSSKGEANPFSPEQAHQWLAKEWADLGCIPSSPVGKVLNLDRILLVAEYAGEKRFIERGEWAHRYAAAVNAVLGRDAVRVDVAEHVVG
jgi:hypothetical protein